jgi:two-component system sensor histidine kinase SenX3
MTAYLRHQVHRTYPMRDVIVHLRSENPDERRRRNVTSDQGSTIGPLLRDIVAGARIGLAVVDSRGELILVNARAEELGLVRDGHLDDRARVAAQRALGTGEDEEVDLSELRPQQADSTVRGYVRLLTERNRRLAVVSAQDDCEMARLEATRRDFVANVSHELKTPVGAMSLLAEALLANVDDPDTVYRFGEKIFAEAQRLGQMVGELIELSRLQGAEPLPNLAPVDIDTVVADAIARCTVSADTANIVVSTDAPSGFKARATTRCWSPRWPTSCPTRSRTHQLVRRCRSAATVAVTTWKWR